MSSKRSLSKYKYSILLNLSNIKVPSLSSEVSRFSIPSTTLTLDVLTLKSFPIKLVINSSNV
jgi:hypothetical protein